jgi:putative membrane protein
MLKSRPGRAALAWRLAPLALILGACAPAPTPTPGIPAPTRLSDANISSIAQTYNAGEVQLGEMAATRSTNPAVKAFAQMMVRDHGEANGRLGEILSAKHIQPAPSSVTTDVQNFDKAAMSSLQNRSGADFDRTYMDSEISHHQWIINQLDSALIPEASDGALKDYLKAGRKLEANHLQEAQRIRASLGGS